VSHGHGYASPVTTDDRRLLTGGATGAILGAVIGYLLGVVLKRRFLRPGPFVVGAGRFRLEKPLEPSGSGGFPLSEA
jgi:membrane protein YqaA with SNARE-associated domain